MRRSRHVKNGLVLRKANNVDAFFYHVGKGATELIKRYGVLLVSSLLEAGARALKDKAKRTILGDSKPPKGTYQGRGYDSSYQHNGYDNRYNQNNHNNENNYNERYGDERYRDNNFPKSSF